MGSGLSAPQLVVVVTGAVAKEMVYRPEEGMVEEYFINATVTVYYVQLVRTFTYLVKRVLLDGEEVMVLPPSPREGMDVGMVAFTASAFRVEHEPLEYVNIRTKL